MKSLPTQFDIASAESQLAQSKRVTRASFAQVRSIVHSRLARPSSLLIVTGLGILVGVWFARRNNPRVTQDAVPVKTSVVGWVTAYLLRRFGLQGLADAWTRFRHSDSTKK